ncbi:MAG TPA: peptidoglycan-associated lipoprotein Pal [Nitrospiria bacterium]|nr:peptidoglycan-associated lipoprotein Pal [Nitrospiria bacterium]
MRQTGWHVSTFIALGLVASAWLLTGCPKQPTKTAEVTPPPSSAPPSASAPKEPESPPIETPAVHEQEIVGAGKTIDALKIVYFDFDKSDIRDDMKPVLQENAKWLSTNTAVKVQIQGNCDERGTNEYNMALGQRRADSIKRYLIALGIPAIRLSTISYGEERPVCTEHKESCWHLNRRGQFAEASAQG